MRTETESKKNQTFELMDVVSVDVIDHLTLAVTFEDNTTGNVTISPNWLTGVFESLKDKELFKKTFIYNGAVTWPNGLDLSPDSMYEAIKRFGSYRIGF